MAEQHDEQLELNFDHISDEDFLNMSEADAMKAAASQKPTPAQEEEFENQQANQAPEGGNAPDGDTLASGSGDDTLPAAGEGEQTPEGQQQQEEPGQGQSAGQGIDPNAVGGEGSEVTEDGDKNATPDADKQSDAKPKEEGKKTPDAGLKLPEGMDVAQANAAFEFYQKLTAPFKADGKDFSVRSAEDAIRLMQQGVNYSRRMHELKPMKSIHRMLVDQGLETPEKLSFLIDLSKGDKTAITKLLKDNNIDPMDLDVSAETGYQQKSYVGNPQNEAFRDALEEAAITPEGQALIGDIHEHWDQASKQRLRENPGILGNLTGLKQSGVYDKVVEELRYQRSIGYLTSVPFLQAFDQVGEAMKNAGIFDAPQPAPAAAQMGQLGAQVPETNPQPVASGARKVQAPKNPAPNPHLSSTPPSKQVPTPQTPVPNFDEMSDAEFLKMKPPR